nr:reverse transcriptase domain-containing protein [Tanacetum cinerariifolium]
MRTRSSSNLVGESSPNLTTSNPKHRNRRRSKQPFILEESPVYTTADQRTMAELLRAHTEGYAEAIVVLLILAEHFELKHSFINMMTSDQFFGLEKDNSHDHIRWFNKITSTIKYKDVPNSVIKLMLVPFSLAGEARHLIEKEPPRSILTWEDLVSKFINEFSPPSRTTNLRNEISNFQQRFDESFHKAWDRYKDLLRACPHHGFTKLHQLDTFYNALNPTDQDSLNSAADGNLLERHTQDVLTIIEKNPSAVSTAMTAILKQFQAIPPPAFVKAVEEIFVTCGGAQRYYQCLAVDGNTFLEFRDNIQGYVSAAAVNYNQGILFTPNIPYPSWMYKQKQQDKNAIQIHKFWQTFKQLHINITLADALILIPKYQKMLKALLSHKEKLLELVNTPLNENCSAVILKKLPEKLGDPEKFLISCGFSELKCKALADLGASINLMPLSVWKKLVLPELISTRITLELANHAIFTPARIARDVFVPVVKFTFLADFVIVDYESDPRVPLILGRPFLRTACVLIDVHGEEMILHDDLFPTNHLSGNPTFSSHTDLTSPEVIDPLSGSTTSSSPDHFLEEFANELALITFPSGNDDLPFDIESDLREIEYLLNHDPIKERDSILEDSVDECNLANPNDKLVDTIPEMFTDEHTIDYSSSPIYDDYDDDRVELESDNDNVYDDPSDSKEDKIKESKLLIDELDLPRSSDFLSSPEYDSFLFEDFSEVDVLPLTNNEDKVFNLGIRIHENLFEVTIQVTPDKNVKKISISHASLILEDFNPPSNHELPFHKEVPGSETLLSVSSENDEKVFKLGILTSKRVHTSLLLELSHRDPKAFKFFKNFESPMEIFPCSYREDIRILDVPCLCFYPP